MLPVPLLLNLIHRNREEELSPEEGHIPEAKIEQEQEHFLNQEGSALLASPDELQKHRSLGVGTPHGVHLASTSL